MKKLTLLIVASLCIVAMAFASPVDVNKAKLAGKQFVASHFETGKHSSELELVYTGIAERGEPCFYVFNVGTTGFVIVSADDRFRPITGYSDKGVFATEDRSPELDYYLGKIIEARSSDKAVLYEDAAAEWQSLLQQGKTISRHGGKSDSFLCETRWNQNSPYNLYAPSASGGPGGRCYAGCVATAMSQLMKYWDYPAVGTGSHSYYGSYGHLSANFGATTYQWEHMPDAIYSSSPDEEIEAVALLMYHCGVSVDMMFSPNGSGAYSDDVPYAIQHYFSYSNQAEHLYRNYYSLEQWKAILREQFDLGWPVYYSGYSDSGGHAFVCDGYDDNDLFHYNWGWGGNSDGWFVVDEIDYANWASIIRNYVPTAVYENMPMGPENFTVESLGDTEFTAALSWQNPTQNIHGESLTSIEKVVVCRDGKPIQVFENPAPGQQMSYNDHYLPTIVSYSVYAVVNSAKGFITKSEPVTLGPTCDWTVEMTSTDPQGWRGSSITVTDGKGIVISTLSLNSYSQTQTIPMPMGMVSFSWKNDGGAVDEMHFEIKNANGTTMTSYSGTSHDLEKGLFYRAVNACQSGQKAATPIRLTADKREDSVMLQWEMAEPSDCTFFIYRDGMLHDFVSGTSYLDVSPNDKFHSYFVTAFNGIMESDPSNSCNVQPESDCLIPTNVSYTLLSKDKIRISWDAPQASNVSGYRVYRRMKGGEFIRFKNLSATSFVSNIMALSCEEYDYAVTAYYSQSHCESAFGTSALDPSLNYVHLNKTVIPVQLDCDVMVEGVKLVWLTAIMADQYSVYRNGILIAEGVTESWYLDTTAEPGQDYTYMVVGSNPKITSNPSNDIHVDWSTLTVQEKQDKEDGVTVYPNPATNQISVHAQGLRQLTVFDLLGQMVIAKTAEDDTTVLDLHGLEPGTYFIRVTTESGVSTKKVMKR